MTRIEVFKKLMDEKKMKVSDIVKLTELPYSTVKSIMENGAEKASYINISLICKSLGITTDDLEDLIKEHSDSGQDFNNSLHITGVGVRIKEAREKAGFTQKELAYKIGAKHNSVSNWEKNQNKPDLDTLVLICKILNITPNYLLNLHDDVLSVNENDILTKYRSLDIHGREAVNAILTIETKRIESNTIIESNREITATDERTVINRMKKSPDYLMNRAAHLNKDATPEQIQQDNDMMDDETIWGD